MKKNLLYLLAIITCHSIQAQNILHENFDATIDQLALEGWARTNQSNPLGDDNWAKAFSGITDYFPGGAYNGDADTSYAYVNFDSVLGSGTISNWLISPVITVHNGDVVSFYSRKGSSADPGVVYPDRLELRISTNGNATVMPVGDENVGDFTTLALTINPDLTGTDYPLDWTQYTYTVSGLSGATDVRIGFRYYVTDAGINGSNADYVGIDEVSVDGNLGMTDFLNANFSIYPNPANEVLHVNAKTGNALLSAKITDTNGRTVIENRFDGVSEIQLDTANLPVGVYFLTLTSSHGSATSKFLKK
jgi:hypothetical protein